MMDDTGPEGYAGDLNRRCVTIAEVLKPRGYRSYLGGKWHVASSLKRAEAQLAAAARVRPLLRHDPGAGSFYDPYTLTRDNENVEHEAEQDAGVLLHRRDQRPRGRRSSREHRDEQPRQAVLLYVAYTAPHWPLHALAEDIAKYKGRYDAG